jgi:site-specific DNA-methyltransferase (adenine-specific)
MKADSAFFDLAAGGIDGVGVDFERVVGELKPGAHLLALSPIATHHNNTIGIEDAGMEIRDTVAWVYDSGGQTPDMVLVTVAREPLEGTVAANVLTHGTGGLNVDGCRVATSDSLGGGDQSASTKTKAEGWNRPWMQDEAAKAAHSERVNANVAKAEVLGRWPANLIHDGSDEVVGLFPAEARSSCGGGKSANAKPGYGGGFRPDHDSTAGQYYDSGSAARFFYSAPCLDGLITYLLKLITQPNGTVLTNCDKDKLPNDYNYVGQEL